MIGLYGRLPYPLKTLSVNLYGLTLNRKRYPREFHNILNDYLQKDRHELHCLNFSRVKEIASSSPYYSFHDARSFYDLPVIDKSVSINNYDMIVNKKHIGDYLFSSGTTGTPFRLPVSKEFIYHQWAVFWKFRMLHGLDMDSWCAYFTGKGLLPGSQNNPPYWITSHATKQLLMSLTHLNRDTIELYLNEIKKNKIRWMHAYPSLLNIMSELIREKNLEEKAMGLKLSLITTSSEVISACQKRNIESVFGCKVRELYGMTEGVANIFECEHGSLHVDESFSFVEFIPESPQSKYYKIIGTHYHNKAFPLLRYDTGDLARIDDMHYQCSCGRKSRVVKELAGREQDYLVLSDNTKVVGPDLIFRGQQNIQKYQIHQNQKGHAGFYIVKSSTFSDRDEHSIKAKIHDYLGRDFKYDLIYSDKLPVEKNGKAQSVIKTL